MRLLTSDSTVAIAAFFLEGSTAGIADDRTVIMQTRRQQNAAIARSEPIDVVVSTKWPLAYERGRWTGFRRASPTEAFLSGQYSAQWVKSGTQWLIRSEVFVAIECAPEACALRAVAP